MDPIGRPCNSQMPSVHHSSLVFMFHSHEPRLAATWANCKRRSVMSSRFWLSRAAIWAAVVCKAALVMTKEIKMKSRIWPNPAGVGISEK